MVQKWDMVYTNKNAPGVDRRSVDSTLSWKSADNNSTNEHSKISAEQPLCVLTFVHLSLHIGLLIRER